MVAIMLAPVYVILNVYILARLLRFFTAIHERMRHPIIWGASIVIYTFFMLTPLIGYLIQVKSWNHVLRAISNYWLGVLAIGFVVLVFFDISRIILNKVLWSNSHPNERRFQIGGTCAILIIILLSTYGNIQSKNTKINLNQLQVNKTFVMKTETGEKTNLKVVLISDIHLGYNTNEEHIKQVVEKINEQNPDLVVMAGDIFDNDYNAIKNPDKLAKILSGIKSTYGTYGCWGNHDISEKLLAGFTMKSKNVYEEDNEYVQFLEDSNVKMLVDESILIDDKFYLVGRRDPERSEKLGNERKDIEILTESLDKSKPIILMDHQPEELDEISKAGVDLDLSGHTHAGQVFPGTIIIKSFWENPYGILKKGNMYSCVTSGVGTWGPAMRLGSNSEIMVLDVNFK